MKPAPAPVWGVLVLPPNPPNPDAVGVPVAVPVGLVPKEKPPPVDVELAAPGVPKENPDPDE